MNSVNSNLSQATIEQYKSYFKSINIEQYGAGVLLNALNNPADIENELSGSDNSNDIESIFNNQASRVTIDKQAIQKKLWQDLEKEIKSFEASKPGLNGKFIVAINADTKDGQPVFKVADKQDVMELLSDEDQKNYETEISAHPVQTFQSALIPVNLLKSAGLPELEQVVNDFMTRNKGVFQYLSNSGTAQTDATGAKTSGSTGNTEVSLLDFL